MTLGKMFVVALTVTLLQGCATNQKTVANGKTVNGNTAPVTMNTQLAPNPTMDGNSYLYRAPTPAMVHSVGAIHGGR